MKINLTKHAQERIRQRHIPFSAIRNAFRQLSEIPKETYVLLITKSRLKKLSADISNADSLFIIAQANVIITCFCPVNTEKSLQDSQFKGRKIIVIN
jgi:hypothetical protein